MSGADLFEDGFPHSTKEGYRAGCRGRACPGIEENGISCADAFARYQGDYGFRKKVDAGMSPSEIMAAEAVPIAENPRPKPKVAPKPTVQPLSPEAEAAIESVPADDEAAPRFETFGKPTSRPAVTKEIPLENHGTPKGYKAGCRLRDKCPGVETVGKSCTQAVAEYQRAATAARKRNQVAAAPAPVVEPEVEAEALALEVGPLIGEALADAEAPQEQPSEPQPELDESQEVAPSADELLARIAELEGQLAAARRTALEAALEANNAAQPSTATFADGTRVTVTVTIDRAA